MVSRKTYSETGGIIICDREEAYVAILSDYLRKRSDLPEEIHEFTSVETLKESIGTLGGGLLVIREDMAEDSAWIPENIRVLYLTTDEKRIDGDGYFGKYHSASEITEKIRSVFYRERPEAVRHEKGSHLSVYGVYSPIRRCGRTGFSVMLGEALAETGRVLYLNLEEYAGFSGIFDMNPSLRADFLIGKLLGILEPPGEEEDSSSLYEIFEAAVPLGYMDLLPPGILHSDVRLLHAEHFRRLIGLIEKSGRYDACVIDPGDCTEDLFDLLELCSEIYVPELPGTIEQAKLREFRLVLSELGKDELLGKMIPVRPPKEEYWDSLKGDFRRDSGLYQYVKNVLEKEASMKNG